ncbi:MAG: putative transcriptional regulator [Solirubrobacteraceae bacterium]|jgi:putative transcriptional regulator|nr:putative transcriptional regulator [Solirubrobacteraceae bacterium]
MESLRGHLLVAAPSLVDPNFARAVVLIAEHTQEGALGVVLNRPGEATVGEVVPDLGPLLDADDLVFGGGPVRPDGVMVLAEFDDPADVALPVDGDLGFVALEADMEEISAGRARAFAGHAGWGAGQLDAELAEEAWFVAPFEREDAFTGDPDELWSAALIRKGGEYALVARMPEDPSLN